MVKKASEVYASEAYIFLFLMGAHESLSSKCENMIAFSPITTEAELEQIIELQACNLPKSITPAELASQGFVTVQHDFALLKRINDLEQGILIRDGEKVIGYILAMTEALRDSVTILVSMFDTFDQLAYKGKQLNDYRYIVVGQVCIAKAYRGQGLFDRAYAAYRDLLSPKYDFTITEIAFRNQRSLRAHQRIGFEIIHEYTSPEGEHWAIVVWDWG